MVFFSPFDPKEYKRTNKIVKINSKVDPNIKISKKIHSFSKSDEKSEIVNNIDNIYTYKLTLTDCLNVVKGAAAFSGGGGGAKKWGELFLQYSSSYTDSVQIVDLRGVSNDTPIVPVACMGAPSSLTGESSKALPVLVSVVSGSYKISQGKPFEVVCGVEVGPTNSIVPIFASALSKSKGDNCYVLDGDLQGRAVLKLNMLGPYMFKGVNMIGTFYSYVLPLGANPPPGTIYKETFFMDKNYYTVVGLRVPDSEGLDPSKTEAYLGSVISSAAPNTCICVCFGGLTGGILKLNSKIYTPGSYTQICVPNSFNRSLEMGKLISLKNVVDSINGIASQNSFIISIGTMNKFQSAGGGTRSDIACWTVQDISGKSFIGFYNNESVVVEEAISGSIPTYRPYITTPNSIGVLVTSNFYDPISKALLYEGEFLTNDEIASYFLANPNLKIPVLIYGLPAVDMLLKDQSQSFISPNCWGLKGQFIYPLPTFDDIPFIPGPTLCVNPSYKLNVIYSPYRSINESSKETITNILSEKKKRKRNDISNENNLKKKKQRKISTSIDQESRGQ